MRSWPTIGKKQNRWKSSQREWARCQGGGEMPTSGRAMELNFQVMWKKIHDYTWSLRLEAKEVGYYWWPLDMRNDSWWHDSLLSVKRIKSSCILHNDSSESLQPFWPWQHQTNLSRMLRWLLLFKSCLCLSHRTKPHRWWGIWNFANRLPTWGPIHCPAFSVWISFRQGSCAVTPHTIALSNSMQLTARLRDLLLTVSDSTLRSWESTSCFIYSSIPISSTLNQIQKDKHHMISLFVCNLKKLFS